MHNADSHESEESDGLFFVSHNPASATSIVLLHGLFASHLEWQHVVPHIQDYHVLIPDLPHHSRSRHLSPFTFALAADQVARLIEKHAHGGVAHVVGLSLGGFVTLELIQRHPESVISAFITGSAPFNEWQARITSYPGLIGWSTWIIFGTWLYSAMAWHAGLLDHKDLQKEMLANCTAELADWGCRALRAFNMDHARQAAQHDKRVLVAAAERGDVRDRACELAAALRQDAKADGRECQAYLVKDACHTWNLQLPTLFAAAIRAWVERQPLPSEFVTLEEE